MALSTIANYDSDAALHAFVSMHSVSFNPLESAQQSLTKSSSTALVLTTLQTQHDAYTQLLLANRLRAHGTR